MKQLLRLLVLSLLPFVGCGSTSHPTGLRVAVIGLDGATFDLLDPWMEEGILPNLARMREAGYSAPLESVVPPLSAPAWTTAVTGVNPGKHGIFDFELVDRERFLPLPATSLDRRAKAVWEYLTESGRRSVILSIPLTTPPDPLDGIMISGFPHLRKTGFTHPPELEQGLGPYRLDRYGEYLPPGGEEAFLANLIATREARFRNALKLYQTEEWDLFWVVFMGTDKVQHFFWQFMDPASREVDPELRRKLQNVIRDFWIRIDQIVGEFLAATKGDTILFVLSDHGFQPVTRELQVLRWLWEEGYCDINPPRSRVFYFTHLGGRMTVNRKGSFPGGVVSPGEEYDALVDELKAKLLALRDSETEDPVVSAVYRRDEVYSGPCLDDAPDLLLEPAAGYLFSRGSPLQEGSIFQEPSFTFSGYHHPTGILLVHGPQVRRAKGEGGARLVDLVPTIMRVLGETVPARMDGVFLKDLFLPGIDREAPPHRGSRSIKRNISPQRRREERGDLKALPYLG